MKDDLASPEASDGTVWYDGARRPRAEVVQRVERDALAFIETVVDGLNADDSPWEALIEDIDVPVGLDVETYATFYRGCRVWPSDNRTIVLSMDPRLPRTLQAIHDGVRHRAWCWASDASRPGQVILGVAHLDLETHGRVAMRLADASRAAKDGLARGVDALRRVVHSDALPLVDSAVAAAMQTIGEICARKNAELDALLGPETSCERRVRPDS